MNRKLSLTFVVASLSAVGAFAQSAETSAVAAASSSSPVAYVYVSRPTHIDGFAASSSGVLTPVPGSPFANTSVVDMSVTRKFLFGESQDLKDVYSYAINSKGSLTKVDTVSPWKYEGSDPASCAPDFHDMQVDWTQSTLYVQENAQCDTGGAYISYRIESNGDLQYLSNSGGGVDDASQGATERLHFTGAGTFGYDSYCGEDEQNLSVIDIYKRESNGAISYIGQSNDVPAPDSSGRHFCAGPLATDSENHVAVALQRVDSQDGDDGFVTGPFFLATYTADANGKLTTTSTAENMPEGNYLGDEGVTAISIDPTNQFLAAAGEQGGFAVYHFNGSKPMSVNSDVKQNSTVFQEFGWDKSHHLYALGGGKLFIYTVVSGSVEPVKGSPYSIPEAGSVSVLELQ